MTRSWLRRGLIAAATGGLLLAVPTAASAHPLGNFTVNRYAGVVVSGDAVTVDRVLDIAEIPTAQRTPAIDTDRNGTLSDAELSAWSTKACASSATDLRLTVAGTRIPLTVTTAAARTLQGQAGLPTLRLECSLRAAIVVAPQTALALADTTAGNEVGWREMTARGDGTTLTRSSVPPRSTSARLSSYPKDLLSSPLDVRTLQLTVSPGGPRLGATTSSGPATRTPVTTGLTRGADRFTLAFEGLVTRSQGSVWLGLVALLAAIALGAGHALAPGHGKTVMAFYLSGRRAGAWRSAAIVGGTVTVTHTAGVLLLGLLVSAGTAFVPARVYPWLSVVSGLMVALVGLTLLREAARRGGPGTREHADGSHSHGLLGKAHSHVPVATDLADTTVPADTAVSTNVAADSGAPVGTVALLDRPERHHGEHPHAHPHPHDEHPHDSQHDHPHPHEHSHGNQQHDHPHPHPHDEASGEVAPSRRGLVAMGLAGGLLPSPSALLVLLGAIALGHAWFGVALVVAFGLGMAATLAVVGVLVMRLRERAERRFSAAPRLGPVLRVLPVLTAVVVLGLGLVLAARGFAATGV